MLCLYGKDCFLQDYLTIQNHLSLICAFYHFIKPFIHIGVVSNVYVLYVCYVNRLLLILKLKNMKFETVKIYYNKSMLPYFDQARNEINEDGISLVGINWEVVGKQLVISITMPQQERYLISLGIKAGKAYSNDLIAKVN
jgi:hypothetical protein